MIITKLTITITKMILITRISLLWSTVDFTFTNYGMRHRSYCKRCIRNAAATVMYEVILVCNFKLRLESSNSSKPLLLDNILSLKANKLCV